MAANDSGKSPVTLCVDVGGTGLKIMLLDPQGKPLTDRMRTPTPEQPTPARLLAELDKLKEQVTSFDRIAVGFPGVVKRGIIYTAANLDPQWVEYNLKADLEKRW
jgi:polyphosphate glucokinase